MGKTEHSLLSSNHNLFPLYLTGLGGLDFSISSLDLVLLGSHFKAKTHCQKID